MDRGGYVWRRSLPDNVVRSWVGVKGRTGRATFGLPDAGARLHFQSRRMEPSRKSAWIQHARLSGPEFGLGSHGRGGTSSAHTNAFRPEYKREIRGAAFRARTTDCIPTKGTTDWCAAQELGVYEWRIPPRMCLYQTRERPAHACRRFLPLRGSRRSSLALNMESDTKVS